jgi:hypothetical protein
VPPMTSRRSPSVHGTPLDHPEPAVASNCGPQATAAMRTIRDSARSDLLMLAPCGCAHTKRALLHLTSLRFTKSRGRPKGGAGISRPFPSYSFHSVPGQHAKRARRDTQPVRCSGPFSQYTSTDVGTITWTDRCVHRFAQRDREGTGRSLTITSSTAGRM